MAGKLITLNDAALQLDITPEKLNELRQSNQIYGYRDGSSWKFKADDVDRLRDEMAFGGPAKTDDDEFTFGEVAEEDPLELTTDFMAAEEEDVLLFAEADEAEEAGPSSTVVGKRRKGAPEEDSEEEEPLELLGEDDAGDLSESEEILLDFDDDVPAENVKKPTPAAPTKRPSASDDDILAGAIDLGGDDEVSLDFDDVTQDSNRAGSSNVLGGASDVHDDDGHVLLNPNESQIDPQLAESQTVVKKRGDDDAVGSSFKLGADDDIFGSGSDVTHRPSDSGILLIDPGDSGMSLDSAPEVGGSALNMGGSKLNLAGETSDFDFGDVAEMKGDDDFLLTPLEEVSEDDSDSGSQVIMLDTDDSDANSGFGEGTATLLASDIPGLAGMLEEASPLGGFGGQLGGLSTSGAAAGVAAAGMMMVPAVRETPFPGWLVGLLGLCTLTMGLCGAMMFDLMLNMWSWDGPYPINSAIMDVFAGK